VIVEIALALLLAVGAMLAVRSFAHLTGQSLGFEAEGVTVTRLTLGGERYASPAVRLTFMTELLEQLEAAQGTQAVSLTTGRPLRAGGTATRISRSDDGDPANAPIADVRAISPDYFSALRIPVRAGRVFDDELRADAPLQAVIDQRLATALWGREDAVGRSVDIVLNNGLTAEVVGVVDDVRMLGPRSEGRSTLYLSHRQWVPEEFDILIRSTFGAAVLPSLREAVRALNPTLPLQGTTLLTDDISESMAQDRATMILLSGFSVVALLLAAAGVYGLLAIEVGHRRREIGVRMALGASTHGLALSVVQRALRLALVGAAAGVAAGLVLTRYMTALLYGIEATDPLTFAITAATLIAVAVIASGLPAWRATRVDPLEAVRVD
jgi:predicted permease